MEKKDTGYARLREVFEILHGPGGCPWDRSQTLESLLPRLDEETAEYRAAVASGDAGRIREELGDLLLLVMAAGQVAARQGLFTVEDVIAGLTEKLVRRHSHVFGDRRAKTPEAALANWRREKRRETR